MPQETYDSPQYPQSPAFGHIDIDSPKSDNEESAAMGNDRVPDLSFLSANFSTDSFHNGVEDVPTTPLHTQFSTSNTAMPNASSLNNPYGNRRASVHGSNSSLPSVSVPVGQASFSYHQRTSSSSASNRARPKSFMGMDQPGQAIWESGSESPIQTSTYQFDATKNRNSLQLPSRRSSFTPANLPPPADSRRPRSRSGSPSRSSSPVRRGNTSPYRSRAGSPSKLQPFNFKPQDFSMPNSANGSPSLVMKPAHRKGHRYKHSSVSMNFFQEPLPIADVNQQPNLIPDSYPIPNLRESFSSAGPPQKFKLALSLAHFATAVVVFVVGVQIHQPAFSTLAHLVFYDSLGSLMVSCVDIMSNFEVWGKSSIAYPFGLGRLETLAGFALSTSSVMVGCDLVSHFLEETIIGLVDSSTGESAEHGSHHIHESNHGPVDWIIFEVVLALVIGITWFTSSFIFGTASISKLMAMSSPGVHNGKGKGLLDTNNPKSLSDNILLSRLKGISRVLINNPIRLLTLVYSMFLTVSPLLQDGFGGFDLDEVSTLVVASLLCYAGWKLVKSLGGVLLVSFPYSGYDYNVIRATIYDKIINSASYKTSYHIEKLYVAKVDPKLFISGIEVIMKGGSSDDESRLVFEINRIITNTVKDFERDCVVETTISTDRA